MTQARADYILSFRRFHHIDGGYTTGISEQMPAAAIDICTERNILRDYLIKHKAEVTGMKGLRVSVEGIIIVAVLILASCSGRWQTFPQATLTEPSSISVQTGGRERKYVSSDEAFHQIFSAIEQNWWQEPRGESGIMQEMEAPVKALCMSSEDEIGEDDVLIIFQYDDPVAWKRADHAEGEPEYYQIQYYLFPLPDPEEEAEHPAWETRGGDMLISEDETFFGKSNVYQYYYSSDLYELVQEAMKKSCCRGLNKPGICGYNRHVIDQKEVET